MSYTDQDIQTALTRELTDERVAVAAAYWLDASPHERWVPDGIILARYARYALSEIERLRNDRHWISVEERLPEQDGYYLTYTQAGIFTTKFIGGEVKAFTDMLGFTVYPGITHWMPLPEPPKEAERR